MFRYVVLGLLQRGTPLHGYALVKRYRERVGTKINTGSFYRELQHLVAARLVRMHDRPGDGDPRRIVYQITDEGRAAFRQWFRSLADLDSHSAREDTLSFRV